MRTSLSLCISSLTVRAPLRTGGHLPLEAGDAILIGHYFPTYLPPEGWSRCPDNWSAF